MGETGVADNSDPANIYFNPANVVGPAQTTAFHEEDKYGIAINWLW